MTDAWIRRCRSALALLLSSSVLIASPGLSSYSAAANNFEGGAPKTVKLQLPKLDASLGRGLELQGQALPQTGIPGVKTELFVLADPAAGLANPQTGVAPQPGTPEAEAAILAKLGENLAPEIEAAASLDNADPRSSGEKIESLIEGRSQGSSSGSEVLPPAELPEIGGFYAHAYHAAVAKAAELGKKPAQVHFYEATASVPGIDGASWKFSFYLTDKETTPEQLAKDKPAVGDIVYVDFQKAGFASRGALLISDDPSLADHQRKSFTQTYDIRRVIAFKQAPLSPDWVPFESSPAMIARGSRNGAQDALEQGRRQGLSGPVSVSFRMRDHETEGPGYWYSFHDNAGGRYLSNGYTGLTQGLPAKTQETPRARPARFVSNGKGVGFAAGLAAGEWMGALTFVSSMVAAMVGAVLGMQAAVVPADLHAGLLPLVVVPIVGAVLILGGSALGSVIGRRMDRNGGKFNLGIVATGFLGAMATLLASGLIAAATGWAWTGGVASFAAVEFAVGFIGLIASAVKSGGKLDFKNDSFARASSKWVISGVLTAVAFASLAS